MNDWAMQLLLAGVAMATVPTLMLILLRAWRARRARSGPEPRCRRCGHIVTPEGDQACHECAADLRKVGVISPIIESRPINPFGLIIGTGVAFAALALIAGPMLSKRLPKWGTAYTATVRLPTPDVDDMSKGDTDYIELAAKGDRGITYRSPKMLELTWWTRENGELRWKVSAYPRRGSWEIKTRSPETVTTSSAFDYTTALHVIKLGGIDPQSSSALVLADDMVTTVRRFQRAQLGGDPEKVGRSWYSPPAVIHQGSSARTLAIAMVVWLPVWAVLAVVLLRRYRLKAAKAYAQEQGVLDLLLVLESRQDGKRRSQTPFARDEDWRSSDMVEESFVP